MSGLIIHVMALTHYIKGILSPKMFKIAAILVVYVWNYMYPVVFNKYGHCKNLVPKVLDHLVIQKLNAEGRLEKKEATKGSAFDKNELSTILRFGAEELFKEDKNEEESKKRLLSMDIDEILERAEKFEHKGCCC
ncbi:hypothetical protein Lser_V15G42845 [Lactuca serriola]